MEGPVKHHPLQLEVLPDGSLGLTYMTAPVDVRVNGLTFRHQILVPIGSDYDDEIEAVIDSLRALLEDALEDAEVLEPAPLEDETDDDELEGD